MNRILLVTLLVALSTAASASDTAGFAFLRVPVGARSVAMGGAFTAVTGDPLCLYWNPANLVSVEEQSVTTTYTSYMMDMQAGFAGWAIPRENSAVGVSLNYFYGGTFTRTTMSNPLGTGDEFSTNDIALTGTYSRNLMPSFSAGISARFVYSSIDSYTGNAFMVDIGGSYQATENVNVAMVVRNAGLQTKAFYEENDPMPTEVAFGGAAKLMDGDLNVAADFTYPFNGDLNVAGGVEYHPVDILAIRVGGNLRDHDASSEAGGGFLDALAFGAGTNWNRLTFDYAFKPFADLGEIHRISLGARL